MSDQVSDELIWSLDTFIKENAGVVDAEADADLVRASFYTQDSGSNALFGSMIDKDLVFGRRESVKLPPPSSSSKHTIAETQEEDLEHAEVQERGDTVGLARERTPAGWSEGVSSISRNRSFATSSFATSSFAQSSSHHSGSEDTDRSFSFASEEEDDATAYASASTNASYSPTRKQSTRSTRRMSDGDQSSYEQRIEASLAGFVTKSLNVESRERAEQQSSSPDDRTFTLEDLEHFAPQFGRELYLSRLGQSLLDGDGGAGKSLRSYRASILQRMSTQADVIRQGWLLKRGEVVPSYRKRWITLRRMPQGPMLTYAKDDSEASPAKMIDLSSTSRCVMVPGRTRAKEHEFKVLTSADSSRREFCLAAASSYEVTEWVCAIQAAINAGNRSTFDGAMDFQRLWRDAGIQGFLVRYGVRKCSSRNRLQTRVLELNFAEQTLTNSRRGETLTTFHFTDIRGISVSSARSSGEEHGLSIDFHGRYRSWPIFLDTAEARDDLLAILQRIVDNVVSGEDLEQRTSRLTLKTGHLETKNAGPHATLKGRLFVCLYENGIVFYPENGDTSSRPWYVVALRGLHVSCREVKRLLVLGRLSLLCSSAAEARAWYDAVLAAMCLPSEIVEIELKERVKIRSAFQASVARLRKLLKARVKPEPNGPPKDQKTVELMVSKLWTLVFPGEPYTSNADPRWLEVGFQRGGPASDLRSSGVLGLYCLIYFASFPSGEFHRILKRTRFGVSEGNMKNYPLAIACINVAAILTETLGFGDAGSHSERCSPSAMKTFSHLVAQSVGASRAPKRRRAKQAAARPLSAYSSWEEIVDEPENHIFETIFCLLFPILDSLFVEMGAGYMEFGQVVTAFRRRVTEIFDAQPKTLKELQQLANEPCTDSLEVPTVLSKAK